MHIDFEKEHEVLFSGASLLLGKSFWYILRADSIARAAQVSQFSTSLGELVSLSKVLTQSVDEIPLDEINWWVYQQEKDHDILQEKTMEVLQHLQKLKDDAEKLDPRAPKDYSEIITELKKFTESHSDEINAFYDYVEWLVHIDPVAPIVLFSNQRWGSTRRNDRTLFVSEQPIDNDKERVQLCTEIALGIRDKLGVKVVYVFRELDYENHERDPEIYEPGKINKKDLIFRTSHQVFKELIIFLELIRDSLRDILKEIDGFNSHTLPVIRKLKLGIRTKPDIRVCLVQLAFSLIHSTDNFGFVPENENLLKEKIFSALRIAQENQVDLICFPELSFKKEWVEELRPLSSNMVIVCGSYYEDSYNVCPVIIRGQIVEPPYKKHTPSPSERGVVLGEGMKSGKIIYIYNTDIGTFSTLTCIDYTQLSHPIISQAKGELDFIVNPCYDDNIARFQAQCNSDCENHNLTIIQVNRADSPDGKYGKSCIISKEHKTIIDSFTSGHFRDSDDEKYLLIKLRNEEVIVADVNLAERAPPVDLPVSYLGRLKIVRHYEYTNSNWVAKTKS